MTARTNLSLLLLAIMLVAAMALGGSARGDMAGLIVLRPLSALLLGWGLWRMRREQLSRYSSVAVMALAVAALPSLQLVPLPFGLWSRAPGHGLVVAIDEAAGLGRIARPLTLTPSLTLNALLSLLVPLAVLALGLGLDSGQRRKLLPVLLAMGGASALLGLAQAVGGPDSPLYIYDFTNPGSAVGLFANRNHAGTLLAMMLPMLAVAWLQAGNPLGQAAAVLGGLTLLPLILITGSRAGLLLGVMALAAIPFVLASAMTRRQTARQGLAIALGVIAVAGLALVTVKLGRAEAWDRLVAGGGDGDARFRILPALIGAIAAFFPWGSGAGSFEPVFQTLEPDSLLAPAYMNHAHNDWLEAAMTGGAAAILLECIALAAFVRALYLAIRRPQADRIAASFQRMGLVLVGMAGLASIGDYPLRTPALAAVFMVALLWAGDAGVAPAGTGIA